MKKYLLDPGYVVSQNDGERHFVSSSELAMLYGVSLADCVVSRDHDLGWRPPEGLVRLRPRGDGDYRLPKEKL